MKNEEFKMVEVDPKTKKALLKVVKQRKDEGNTLQDVLNIWEKGCKNPDYLEWGNQLTKELWDELEKKKNNKVLSTAKYLLGGFKNV